MSHVSDQDLLLMAHRSLGSVREIGARIHLRRCSSCRAKLGAVGSMSAMVAAAVRPGLPAWKPSGITLSAKILIATIAFGGALLLGKAALTSYSAKQPMPPLSFPVKSCEVKKVTPGPSSVSEPARGKLSRP